MRKRRFSQGGGSLDTAWGDARTASWRVDVTFIGETEQEETMQLELHGVAAAQSKFIECMMGLKRFKGGVSFTLPAEWRPATTPLLRYLYSPDAGDLLIEQCLLRKSLTQALEATHCAIYLGIEQAAFYQTFFTKVKSRRTLLTRGMQDDATSKGFRFPAGGAWHRLPLDKALCWLRAIEPPAEAVRANLDDFVDFDRDLNVETAQAYIASRVPELAARSEEAKQQAQAAPFDKLYEEEAAAAAADVEWWEALSAIMSSSSVGDKQDAHAEAEAEVASKSPLLRLGILLRRALAQANDQANASKSALVAAVGAQRLLAQ